MSTVRTATGATKRAKNKVTIWSFLGLIASFFYWLLAAGVATAWCMTGSLALSVGQIIMIIGLCGLVTVVLYMLLYAAWKDIFG